ncbi:MAG TPA: DUF885 domain-containing protein, partial [Thermoanaerobaculia bacterium]
MTFRRLAAFATIICLVAPAFTQTSTPEWVKRSNANSKILLDVLARFAPESAARFGVDGYDAEVFQLPNDINAKTIAAVQDAIAKLEAKLATETDPAVRQDLQILISSARDNIEGTRLTEKYQLPYFNLSLAIFQSMRSLLDDQVAAERRPAALVRMKKYTGLETGFTPITTQAIAYTRARLGNRALIGPFKDKLEKDLSNSDRYMTG